MTASAIFAMAAFAVGPAMANRNVISPSSNDLALLYGFLAVFLTSVFFWGRFVIRRCWPASKKKDKSKPPKSSSSSTHPAAHLETNPTGNAGTTRSVIEAAHITSAADGNPTTPHNPAGTPTLATATASQTQTPAAFTTARFRFEQRVARLLAGSREFLKYAENLQHVALNQVLVTKLLLNAQRFNILCLHVKVWQSNLMHTSPCAIKFSPAGDMTTLPKAQTFLDCVACLEEMGMRVRESMQGSLDLEQIRNADGPQRASSELDSLMASIKVTCQAMDAGLKSFPGFHGGSVLQQRMKTWTGPEPCAQLIAMTTRVERYTNFRHHLEDEEERRDDAAQEKREYRQELGVWRWWLSEKLHLPFKICYYWPFYAVLPSFVFIIALSFARFERHTFLPLPPQYDFERVPVQKALIPFVYIFMHVALLCFSVIVLPFCANLLKYLADTFPSTQNYIPYYDNKFVHKYIAGIMLISMVIAITLWFIVMGLCCTFPQTFAPDSRVNPCLAFNPNIIKTETSQFGILYDSLSASGSFADPRDNVLFLRMMVVALWSVTLPLIYFAEESDEGNSSNNKNNNNDRHPPRRGTFATKFLRNVFTRFANYAAWLRTRVTGHQPTNTNQAAAPTAPTPTPPTQRQPAAASNNSNNSSSNNNNNSQSLSWCQRIVNSKWVTKKRAFLKRWWYEVVYTLHVTSFWVTVVLALYARFEVFYPIIMPFTIYAADKFSQWYGRVDGHIDVDASRIFMRPSSKSKSGLTPLAMEMVVTIPIEKRRHLFLQAGGYANLQVPSADWHYHTWHSFALMSEPGEVNLRFLVAIKGDWTTNVCKKIGKNKRLAAKTGKGRPVPITISGTYGTPFNFISKQQDYSATIILAGRFGVPGAISALKEVILKQGKAQATTKPRPVFFIWSCSSVDELGVCFKSLEQILEDAVGEGYLNIDDEYWRPYSSAMLDWLSVVIFVTGSGDGKARTQAALDEYLALNAADLSVNIADGSELQGEADTDAIDGNDSEASALTLGIVQSEWRSNELRERIPRQRGLDRCDTFHRPMKHKPGRTTLLPGIAIASAQREDGMDNTDEPDVFYDINLYDNIENQDYFDGNEEDAVVGTVHDNNNNNNNNSNSSNSDTAQNPAPTASGEKTTGVRFLSSLWSYFGSSEDPESDGSAAHDQPSHDQAATATPAAPTAPTDDPKLDVPEDETPIQAPSRSRKLRIPTAAELSITIESPVASAPLSEPPKEFLVHLWLRQQIVVGDRFSTPDEGETDEKLRKIIRWAKHIVHTDFGFPDPRLYAAVCGGAPILNSALPILVKERVDFDTATG